jgi:hypothetical protein
MHRDLAPGRHGLLAACVLLGGCMLDARVITDARDDTSTGPGGSAEPEPTGADACATGSASALARCVDAAAIARDITFIAEVRAPDTPHWLAVQELCADRLTMLGFTVEMHAYSTGINVIGRLPGTQAPDEVVLVGAHYDHIPGCLGADDNATGVGGGGGGWGGVGGGEEG